MSILTPGKMPPSCEVCPCAYYTEGVHHDYCQAVGYDTQLPDEGRPDWCPLIELPPHGRLIDADALRSNMYDSLTKQFYINQKQIEVAPTIIPADPEGGADNG